MQSAPATHHNFSLGNLLPPSFLSRGDAAFELGTLDGHAVRVAAYSYAIAMSYGLHPKTCERLRLAAAFHDIGKTCLPKTLLNKPGVLTSDERHLIETHTVKGHDLLYSAGNPLLRDAATVALSHHEYIDGSGYPNGLRGTDIPLGVRIVSVADVFDALTTKRSYRDPISETAALRQISQLAQRRFDPIVILALNRLIAQNPSMGQQLRWFTRSRTEPPQRHPTRVGAHDDWQSSTFVQRWVEADALPDFWQPHTTAKVEHP